MAVIPKGNIVQSLRRVALGPDGGKLTDGQLLEAFLSRHDEAAFEALVRRHGPMILGVCRRILHHDHDAEDAFQATFLVLVRKATTLRTRATVGNWLFGVAYHTALKARARNWKRRTKEVQGTTMPRPTTQTAPIEPDWLVDLDHALSQLPDKFREAVVLCDLEGRSRLEAARQLGVAVGTLSGRLSRARRMLAQKLARYKLAMPAGGLAVVLTPSAVSASVPPTLLASTVRAAFASGPAVLAGVVSTEVAALTEGTLQMMFLSKIKAMSGLVLSAACVVTFAAGGLFNALTGPQAGRNGDPETAPVWVAKAPEIPAVVMRKPPDPKRLVKLAERLESKDYQECSAALAELAKLLAAQADSEADFGPVIEPLFNLAGWGGIARKNAQVAEDLIVEIGLQALPVVKQRLQSADTHDRRVAAELLVRIGPPDAALVAVLRPLLTDQDGYVRRAAIEGLGIVAVPANDVIDDLEKVATNDPILPRRVAARAALIRVDGASVERVRDLAAFLDLKEPCDGAAMLAASELGNLGPKARHAEAELLAALKHTEAGVRINAAAALGAIGANSPEVVTALIAILKNDPAKEARRAAAGSLGEIGSLAKEAIPGLRAALIEEDKGGWWVAADALGKIGGSEVVAVLMAALANANDDIRYTAIKGLGKLGAVAKPAIKALAKARQEDPRASNRAAAAVALDKIERAIQNVSPQ